MLLSQSVSLGKSDSVPAMLQGRPVLHGQPMLHGQPGTCLRSAADHFFDCLNEHVAAFFRLFDREVHGGQEPYDGVVSAID